jgi:hypothetical protein
MAHSYPEGDMTDSRGLQDTQIVSSDKTCRVSTIACGKCFTHGDPIFALTSAHAFEDMTEHRSPYDLWTRDYSLKDESMSGSESSGMDDDYDWDELDELAAEDIRTSSGQHES